MSTYTVSDYLLDRLKSLGLTHLFGVPGDYASTFLLTLEDYEGIEYIPNINELGVGYASDGYGRLRGLAACTVQYGVGTFSILNAIAGSYVERAPVALIAPSPSTKDRELTATEGILFHHSTGDFLADQQEMEKVTVASVSIGDAAKAPEQIDAALVAMLTHSRPVYIEVWQDIFGAACARPEGSLQAEPATTEVDSLDAMVEAAWARIQAAELPILWAGVEIQRFGLQENLQRLVDASGMFFTTTSLGKTVLDESQVSFIGTYAGPASPALTRKIMEVTQCPIALGTIITDDYLDIMAVDNGQIIEVTESGARIGYAHYPNIGLADFLDALLQKVEASPDFPRAYEKPNFKPDQKPVLTDKDELRYESFYHTLSHWLISEKQINQSTLILGESTSLYVFGNLFGLPQDSFVAQAAWGSLGHETGCALGIELGTGKRPIVVAGDGGFMMMCQAMSSLARQQSNAIVFVMSNKGYAIEQAFVDIKAFTPQGSYAGFDLLPTWNYIALAEGFGAKGYQVETVGALKDLLCELEQQDGVPRLIEVKIPLKDIPPQLYRLATTP